MQQAAEADTKTGIEQTKESIKIEIISLATEKNGIYTLEDVESAIKTVLGSEGNLDMSTGEVTTTNGNIIDINDILVNADDVLYLGVSDNEEKSVIANISSGTGTSIMYAKVTGENISNNYNESSYPVTTATYEENGEIHYYIFAGWFYSEDENSYFTEIPTTEEEYVYAKFIDQNVLSMFYLYTESADSLRMITSIHSKTLSGCRILCIRVWDN